MQKSRWTIIAVLGLCSSITGPLWAGESTTEEDNVAEQQRVVAATVDGEPIFVEEVRTEVDRVLRGRDVTPEAREKLLATSLDQLVRRRLILAYLSKTQIGLNERELTVAVERVATQLKQQKIELDDYLRQRKLTMKQLRRALAWQHGWQRYLDRYLTEENLAKYFEQHRREFDGTRMRVSHILIRVPSTAEETRWQDARDRCRKVREQLLAEQLTFAEAAELVSQSPSAKSGGDAGWIRRNEPMPESFAAAAFKLEVDEISEPVDSPFGVHLIKCVKVEPGQRRWEEVRPKIVTAVTKYLFDWVADQQSEDAKIEMTGALPYFRPGTKEVVSGG